MTKPHRSSSIDRPGETAGALPRVYLPRTAGGPAVDAAASLAELTELADRAAARLMRPYLERGQSSVCIASSILLTLQTAAVATLRVHVERVGAQGRIHHFAWRACADTVLVATGEHSRAIVLPPRLSAAMRRRAGRPSMLLRV